MHRACAGKLYKLPWDTHGIQLYTYIPQFHCNPFRHVSQEQIERKNAQFFVLKAGTSQEKGCLSGGPLGGREAEKGQEKERGRRGEGEGKERGGRQGKGRRRRRSGRRRGKGDGGKGGREGAGEGEGKGRRGKGRRRRGEREAREGRQRRGRRRRGEGEAGARAPHVGSQKKPRQKAFAARCEAFCRGVWCGAARLRPDAADVRKKRERSSATALPPP